MKEKIRFFILGFVVCLAFGGLVYGSSQVADVYFSEYPIKINGNSYTAEMPVLNYQDRTYLALREFGTATNNEIDFVDETIIINNTTTEQSVYITRTGSKYHYSNFCNGGTYIKTSLEDALKLKLEPCNKCAK